MKIMMLMLALMTMTGVSYAGEKWEKTKKVVNEAAQDVDRGTRKIIKKGKEKVNKERQEEKAEEKRNK